MITTPFLRVDDDSLAVVNALVDGQEAFFAVDTGASQTVIDLNFLLIIGYKLSQSIGTRRFETASGITETYVFQVTAFDALGLPKRDFEVCSFDFLAQGLASEFMGLIGLDFFAQHKICLDFRLSEITVS